MVIAKKIIFAKKFVGDPTPDNFRLESETLPALKDGEILCEAIFLSVDPFMRTYMMRYPENTLMMGGQVAKITESKNPDYPVGGHVTAYFGWRSRTVVKPNNVIENSDKALDPTAVTLLPEFKTLSLSLAIGYLGMPGATSYFGFLEICKPKAGEVVVVSGAAGAVGSLVGQIAKIKGCKVIGYVGSDDKCAWLKDELGFDYAFNYKNVDITKSLQDAAPEGVDCYFDNVGGDISSAIINKMNFRGRISVCGSVASYNDTEVSKAPVLQSAFVSNQLLMEGFLFYRWADRFPEAIKAIAGWIKDGKVKYRESVTKGFENMPQAFMDMLKGKNVGKAVIQV